jgi:hypothetical protein
MYSFFDSASVVDGTISQILQLTVHHSPSVHLLPSYQPLYILCLFAVQSFLIIQLIIGDCLLPPNSLYVCIL